MPRSGFDPPKYHTTYDALVDVAMMEEMDAVLVAEPGLTFALPFDLNVYAPAHNSVSTKDWTGDHDTDFTGNRSKRFFLDSGAVTRAARMELGVELPARVLTRAEIERSGAQLRAPEHKRRALLLQTYARDTGAILTTLSVPLYVKGERFGCVSLGCGPRAAAQLGGRALGRREPAPSEQRQQRDASRRAARTRARDPPARRRAGRAPPRARPSPG